ncbi:hypothetical protein [Roseiconus lacunae]|uniref:Transposase n=1 Tax=Roseiconus lacunae TaxID=2605694 RepID=A0ABT7PI12_9BACT|nr:hypothetical protein [Roseiconus lacunae]MDM4015934.1 hypothetical protein [Roseiconus lacunae]
MKISRGLLAKVSQAIASLYEDLFSQLKAPRILNIDETGHCESDFTVFKIDPSRGSVVLHDVLGEEFEGIIGCDNFNRNDERRI